MNEVQDRELDIFKEIIKVIELHNLRYFAIGGTCIGAVRHKGFIPWDDDIDIAMPREDYELFRTKFYKELPSAFAKMDGDNTKRHRFLFTKIHDTTTTLVGDYAKDSPDRYTGVFVDIMPIDGLPNDPKKQKNIIDRHYKLRHLNDLTRPFPYDYIKEKGLMKAAARVVLNKIFGYNHFSSKIVKALREYDFDKAERVFFSWRPSGNLGNYKRVFRRSYFDSYVSLPFEDTYIRVPVEYHKYLTEDFGNYMELPPKEERVSQHNVYICDMGKPCAYYAKLREENKK